MPAESIGFGFLAAIQASSIVEDFTGVSVFASTGLLAHSFGWVDDDADSAVTVTEATSESSFLLFIFSAHVDDDDKVLLVLLLLDDILDDEDDIDDVLSSF